MTKHEYRFGVVLYGGVSLAVYINGVCQELAAMVRGSRKQLNPRETEPVYRLAATLDPTPGADNSHFGDALAGLKNDEVEVAATPARKFTIDILSGTSAGGLNAVYLAKSLVFDIDLSDIKAMWIRDADLTELIEDERSYDAHREKHPLHTDVQLANEPGSLLSGDLMYLKLFDALERMDADDDTQPDPDLADALDCYLTTTDLRGTHFPLRLSEHTTIDEAHHRTVFHFVYGTSKATGGDRNDFVRKSHAALAFASRATSAFPFAFEPAQVRQVDEDLARWLGRSPPWDDLAENPFLAGRTKPSSGANWAWDMGFRWYSDGGDIDNKPFSYVLSPLSRRRAEIPVTRKLLYVEPDPEEPANRYLKDLGRPSIREAVLDAYSLGRYEAIRTDIEGIRRRNSLVEQLKASIGEQIAHHGESFEGEGQVSFTSDRAESGRWLSMTRGDLLRQPGGSRDLAYERFRARLVAGELGDILNSIAGFPEDSAAAQTVRELTKEYVERRWLDQSDDDAAQPAHDAPDLAADTGRAVGMRHRDFLDRFDLSFRLRRLVFLEQVVAELQQESQAVPAPSDSSYAQWGLAERPDFESLREIRAGLNTLYAHLRTVGRHLRTGHPEVAFGHRRDFLDLATRRDGRLQIGTASLAAWVTPERRDAIIDGSIEPGELRPLLDQICQEVGSALGPWFDVTQEEAGALFEEQRTTNRELGDFLERLWKHYARYDGLILPYWETARGELAKIDVVRVSPQDATQLVQVTKIPGHEVDKLGGNALGHFGGFLSADWRANDIMWGRLDAAEILIRNIVPEPHLAMERGQLIDEAHRRIFAAEKSTVEMLPSIAGSADAVVLDPTDHGQVQQFLRDQFVIDRRLGEAPAIGRTIEALRRVSSEHGRGGASGSSRWVGRFASIIIRVLQFAFPFRTWDRIALVILQVLAFGSLAGAAALAITGLSGTSVAAFAIGVVLLAGSALAALLRRGERGWKGITLSLCALLGVVALTVSAAIEPLVCVVIVLIVVGVILGALWWFAWWAPERLRRAGEQPSEVIGSVELGHANSEIFDWLLRSFEFSRLDKAGSTYRLETSPAIEGTLLNVVSDRRLIATIHDCTKPTSATSIVGFTMRPTGTDRTSVTFRQTGLPRLQWRAARDAWEAQLLGQFTPAAPDAKRTLKRGRAMQTH